MKNIFNLNLFHGQCVVVFLLYAQMMYPRHKPHHLFVILDNGPCSTVGNTN